MTAEHIIIILIAALATFMTRSAPFIFFKDRAKLPRTVGYLGRVLPPAVFAMLVVYCLKGVELTGGTHGIPELIAISSVVLMHLLFRKTLLSIAGGTVIYVILVNFVFI